MRAWVFVLFWVLLIQPGRAFGSDSGGAPELSKAMKAAASGDPTPVGAARSSDSKSSPNGNYNDDSDDDFFGELLGEFVVAFLACFHGVHYEELKCPWHFPIDAEYVVPLKGDIQSITRFSLTPLSLEGERAFFGFYFNGGMVKMEPNTLPAAATSSAWTIGCGASFRYYFARPDKAINPYLTTRVGWMSLNWDYRNPVFLGGGGAITSDRLNALDTYAGIGIACFRNQPFSPYVEVGYGGAFFSGTTSEGFRNDVFADHGYVAVKAGLSVKF